MIKKTFLFCSLIFISVFLCFSSTATAWYVEGKNFFYDPTGYSGDIKATSSSYNKIRVEARVFNVNYNGDKTLRNGYLYCIFYREDYVGHQTDFKELKEIMIKVPEEQSCRLIEGRGTFIIDVPEDAEYVELEIYTDKQFFLPEGKEARYILEKYKVLFDFYGFTVGGHQAAWLYLRR
jgi:hypothetical protein